MSKEKKIFQLEEKEICITSTQIKLAIDLLVNENEILQDKVYKQEDKIEELRALYQSEREVKEDYKSKVNKAIEYIEYYFAKGRTKNHKQFDLSLYEILTGKNLFNLTMEEIEQFFKGDDKE